MSRRSSATPYILGALLVAGFIAGLTQLLALRMRAGDAYPAYSSLRADPLGAKAFYDGLDDLPGTRVRRYFQSLADFKQDDRGPLTLLFLGAQDDGQKHEPKQIIEGLEAIALRGGRVVVTFFPQGEELWRPSPSCGMDEDDGDSESDAEENEDGEELDGEDDGKSSDAQPESDETAAGVEEKGEEEDGAAEEKVDPAQRRAERYSGTVSLVDRWGIDFSYRKLPVNEDNAYETVWAERTAAAPATLPEELPWHSALYFRDLDESWQVLYTRNELPVVVERSYGAGSLVFVSDAYSQSNEALRKERQTALLAWLVGPNEEIVFDESHLGLAHRGGIMALARKYRLHGFFVGLALLVGLFLWRNTMPLVPRYGEEDVLGGSETTAGKDAASGFLLLLKRSVQPNVLLDVCVKEWRRSFAGGRPDLQKKAQEMERIAAELAARDRAERSPAAAYCAMCAVAAERKGVAHYLASESPKVDPRNGQGKQE